MINRMGRLGQHHCTLGWEIKGTGPLEFVFAFISTGLGIYVLTADPSQLLGSFPLYSSFHEL